MLQVMDQISGLAGQINDVSHRLSSFGTSVVHKDELRGELDSAIRGVLHRELRDLREDVRGLQSTAKRTSDYSQSPASRSHFASPNPLSSGQDYVGGSRRQYEGVRDAAGTYSPAGSHSDSAQGPVRVTPQNHVSRKLPAGLDPTIKNFDPLAGQLSIPLHHSTAAHKLLIAWDAIHPFYARVMEQDYAANYVMSEETQRGNLRIFGQGEGSDGAGKDHPPQLTKQQSFSDYDGSNASTASSTDGNWGVGFDGPMVPASDTQGGLNLDGTLCLNALTISRLYQSFLSHIWILHPILNKTRLHANFERFVRQHGHDYSSYVASLTTSPTGSTKQHIDQVTQAKAPKRKRSDHILDDSGPSPASRGPSESSRFPLERSMNNALMLLVFALGHLCEYKGPVPPPVNNNQPNPNFVNLKSPPSNTPMSAATPGFGPESATPDAVGRSPFSDNSGRYENKVRNIDKIPGLAYFAYAVGILGEHHGTPDLLHVQSSLLAGLYLGQMARVIDSWRWINKACTDCQLLFKDERYGVAILTLE